jgi:hypothetical protein
MTVTVAGWSRAEESQGTVRPTICAAGVPAAEMACGVAPGTSDLEGREESNALANWETDIGGAVGGSSGDKAGEAEDVLSAIAGGRGSSSAVTSTQNGQQRRLPRPLPSPSPASQVSPAWDVMAGMLLSLLSLLLVGVQN